MKKISINHKYDNHIAGTEDLEKIESLYGIRHQSLIEGENELSMFWSANIMAYGVVRTYSTVFHFITNDRKLVSVDIDTVPIERIKRGLQSLPKDFCDNLPVQKQESDIDCYSGKNYYGWLWIHLGDYLWVRIHETIWPGFIQFADVYTIDKIQYFWTTIIVSCILDREQQIQHNLSHYRKYDVVQCMTDNDVKDVKTFGVIACREGEILCGNLKSYYSYGKYEAVKNEFPSLTLKTLRDNEYPGWVNVYCGMGHHLIVREEYYRLLDEKLYGMGFNSDYARFSFGILCDIIFKMNPNC